MSALKNERGVNIGGLDMRRAMLIARRDYLGYVKTWGFWVSFFLPFIMGGLFLLLSFLDLNFESTRYETIVDDTGQHKAAIIAQYDRDYTERARMAIMGVAEFAMSDDDVKTLNARIDEGGVDAAIAFLNAKSAGLGDQLKLPKKTMVFVDPPATGIDALKDLMMSGKTFAVDGEAVALNGILHIRGADEAADSGASIKAANISETEEPTPFAVTTVKADYWSTQVTAQGMQSLARRYFKDRSEALYLESGGLSEDGLRASRKDALALESYDPTKTVGGSEDGQKITSKDKIPYLVAGGMTIFLWLSVFSGAYMLLTSMLEEKLNKLLEMMLATTKFGEIILGKLIGVAALTLTTMLPYLLLGGGALLAFILFGPADVANPIREAFTWKMMVFFPIFLVLGYVFYGCLFIAMGALAESMQDAQTITTPIVMILTLCVLIVPLGFNSPDSSLLIFASWFPLSAPFAAIARLPSDPPAWELFLSAGFLALLSVGVIILASRVFRYGVLSGAGVKGISLWFKRTVLRRKNV